MDDSLIFLFEGVDQARADAGDSLCPRVVQGQEKRAVVRQYFVEPAVCTDEMRAFSDLGVDGNEG